MYRAGYDPQAFISFFEKIQALEKRKPGLVAKAFATIRRRRTASCTRRRRLRASCRPKDEYLVTTSEFDDVKARLARIENKRRLTDTKGVTQAVAAQGQHRAQRWRLEHASGSDTSSDSDDGPPTLHRRDDNPNQN